MHHENRWSTSLVLSNVVPTSDTEHVQQVAILSLDLMVSPRVAESVDWTTESLILEVLRVLGHLHETGFEAEIQHENKI